MRRSRVVVSFAIVLALALGGYAIAQQMRPGPYPGPQMMAQGGAGAQTQVPRAPGMWGPGGWGPMGYGMMGPGGWGYMGHGYGMMGGGMWGSMLGSPEIMGTMLSLRGEMMSLMGRVLQRYGAAMWQMTPDVQRAVQRELLEGMGDILARQGSALKKSAAALGK